MSKKILFMLPIKVCVTICLTLDFFKFMSEKKNWIEIVKTVLTALLAALGAFSGTVLS